MRRRDQPQESAQTGRLPKSGSPVGSMMPDIQIPIADNEALGAAIAEAGVTIATAGAVARARVATAARATGAEVGAARAAPNFIVTPNGQAIRVPTGATGPTATRAPGVQYTGGAGGNGLDSRVTGVRIMEGNANQGPRAVYMNRSGQTVDPATGRTVSNADPNAHHYLEPWK